MDFAGRLFLLAGSWPTGFSLQHQNRETFSRLFDLR
jgi:hypothetical protein